MGPFKQLSEQDEDYSEAFTTDSDGGAADVVNHMGIVARDLARERSGAALALCEAAVKAATAVAEMLEDLEEDMKL